ncbi:hypothetical protein ACFX10_034479 [Malus domestica]
MAFPTANLVRMLFQSWRSHCSPFVKVYMNTSTGKSQVKEEPKRCMFTEGHDRSALHWVRGLPLSPPTNITYWSCLLYNGRILNIRNGTIDEVLGCGFQDISVGESTLVWMELATSGMPTRDVRNDLCKFFFLLGNVSWFCVYRLTI